MELSVLTTSLPLRLSAALEQIARLGFTHVDLVGRVDRPHAEREVLAQSGLFVSCVALGRDLSEGCSLDAADLKARTRAVGEVKSQIADAAQLGARWGYLVPGIDGGAAALERFADSCEVLNTYAAGRMMQLCLEHIPGRALPTVKRTLDWLKPTDLALLLDIGHCLISEEDPVLAVIEAGDRLGYVHLDDNDSVGDLHWPLLTGRLTADMLDAFFAILREYQYRGNIALELNPENPDPVKALQEGKKIVERLM